MLQINVFLR